MRRLILLRHAKSDWPEGVTDRERPLNQRGRTAAPLIGRYLARQALIPDLALVSTARRTRETWELACEAAPNLPAATLNPIIYEASRDILMRLVRAAEDSVHTLIIVGHNPGMEMLAATLVLDGPVADRRRLSAKYPTGGLAVIDLPVTHWHETEPQTGTLARFIIPRDLDDEAE
jgi:phosphohistidine phosphatase